MPQLPIFAFRKIGPSISKFILPKNPKIPKTPNKKTTQVGNGVKAPVSSPVYAY